MTEQHYRGPKILVGGVPFGKDNVGDEAILECVVQTIRTLRPDADIAVSTGDQEATAKKLNVRTYPLFGFDSSESSMGEIKSAMGNSDAFIWSGATGLSDYPDIPLKLLECAAEAGVASAVFCTGMNSRLNPYLYTLLPGKRRSIYTLIRSLTFGAIDLTQKFEESKTDRTRARMKRALTSADMVILRDQESRESILKFAGDIRDFLVAADPAITLKPLPIEKANFSEEVVGMCANPRKKIGLCISAQSPVRKLDELASMLDEILEEDNACIVGIPMNPITDYELLEQFKSRLKHPSLMTVAAGRYEPDAIAGLANEMDVVISSRLHLLILASIHLIPIIGISRGSKVTNFTRQFDLPDVGSVDSLDLSLLKREIKRLIQNKDVFQNKASQTRQAMLDRYEAAKAELGRFLAGLTRNG